MKELKDVDPAAPMDFILEWIGPGKDADDYQLWACRGVKKGCKKRRLKTHRHCENCFLPDESDTLEEIKEKMIRGDA